MEDIARMIEQAHMINSIKVRLPMEDQMFIDHVLLLVIIAQQEGLSDADERQVGKLFMKWIGNENQARP